MKKAIIRDSHIPVRCGFWPVPMGIEFSGIFIDLACSKTTIGLHLICGVEDIR